MMNLKSIFSTSSSSLLLRDESTNTSEDVEVDLHANAMLPIHAQDTVWGSGSYASHPSASGGELPTNTLRYGHHGHGRLYSGIHGSSGSIGHGIDDGDSQPDEIKPNGETDITSMDSVDDDGAHQSPHSQAASASASASASVDVAETGEMGDEDGSSVHYPQAPSQKNRRNFLTAVFLALVSIGIIVGAVVGTQNKRNGGFTDMDENAIVINPDDPNALPPTPSPVPYDSSNDDLNSFPPIDSTEYCPLSLEMNGIVISDFNQSVVLFGLTDNTTGAVGVNNNPNATDPIHALPLCHQDDEGANFPYGRGLWYTVKGPGAVVRATTCLGIGVLTAGQSTSSLPILDTQLTVFSSQSPTCMDGLDCVTHNDDASCGTQSLVTWYAEKDRFYYIYVSGKPLPDTSVVASDENTVPAYNGPEDYDSFSYPTGSFTLTLELAPVGTCEAAIDYETEAVAVSRVIMDPEQQKEVSLASSLIVGTLLGAKIDVDPCVSGEWLSRGGEIWYKVMGTGRWIMASTCSSTSTNEFPPRLALYKGDCDQLDCALAKASSVAPAVDRDCGFGYSLNWWSQPGVVYYLMVYKTNFLPGVQFGLTVENFDPPPNDNCTEAVRLFADGNVTFGSTLRATYTADQLAPMCVADDVVHSHPGVWYKVIGTGTILTASLCHHVTKYDTKISVYQGSCGNLKCVAANDEWCGYQSSVDWESVLGTEYYLLVHGSTGGTAPAMGDFGLAVFEFRASPNDYCTEAKLLLSGSVTAGSTTTASADDYVDSCDRTGAIKSNQSPGVWYKVIGTGIGMRASTCGAETTFDTRVSIYVGEDCQQLRCLISDDNGCGFQSSAYWHSNLGETYWILVTGNLYTSFGDFVLRIEEYRTNTINDFCANAITATRETVNLGSTKNATFDGVETCVVPNTAPGTWYKIQGTGTGMVATTCHILTDFDTRISVFTGSDCEKLECVAGNDDSHESAECGSSAGSRVSWLSNIDQEYHILVHGWGALVGTFGLTIEEVVPVVTNDFCIHAEDIIAAVGGGNTSTAVASGTTINATVDNVPTCGDVKANGHGLWYRAVGTGNRLIASTCNFDEDEADDDGEDAFFATSSAVTDFDTQISIFRGGCGALECLGANNNQCGLQSSVKFFMEEGETFYVLVHGVDDKKGSFTLFIDEVFPQVENDFCDTATPITFAAGGSTNYVIGSTTEASYDTVDQCVVPNTSPGIWYSLTGTGQYITITTCAEETDFDTRLSVYTGSSCLALECVTGNDDTSRDTASCGLASTATWPSIAGQKYYIRVHGWGSLVGNFRLSVSEYQEGQR